MTGLTAELEQAKQDGVSHPENLPFLFKPKQPNGKAVLLIHGFSASPYEMRPLGNLLCAQGYLALGVRLAGHGTSPEDLRICRWQDWFNSVERCYSNLQEAGLPISVVGQSTGALLALALVQHREVERLVLLSPFLKLGHPLARFVGLIKHFIPFQYRQLPQPQPQHYYERRPLASIEQIGKLRNEVEPGLSRIRVPTLVLAAEGDRTVACGTGQALFERLVSPHKEFHLFGHEVPHVLSTSENPKFAETYDLIEGFLSNQELSAKTP